MKTTTIQILRKLSRVAFGLCLGLCFWANNANATVLYWDNNTTSTPSGGVWDTTTHNWASSSTLTASTIVWNTADAAVFCAGSTTAGNITVTVNTANLACGGFFDNGVAGTACNLTLGGTGSLSLNTGLQGIYVSSGQSATVNIPINGAGGVEPQGSGTLNLFAANGYTGGTTLANGTALTYFNNNSAFSSGAITINSGAGAYAPMLAIGGAQITLANAFTGTSTAGSGINFNTAANTPVVCTGTWNISKPTFIQNAGNSSASLTLSGVISGSGGQTFNTTTNNGASTVGGSIILTGVNTFTGALTNTAILGTTGSLTIGGSGSLGSGNYAGGISNASSFVYNSTAAQALSSVISGPGTLTEAGPGILTLSGNHSTYTGITIITGGAIQTGGDSGAGGVGNLGKVPASFVANNITLSGGSLIGNNGGFSFSANRGITLTANSGLASETPDTTTFPQIIAGAFGLTINGGTNNGTVILSGINTYSGSTIIASGKLICPVGSSCANSAVELQSGAELSTSIANNTQQWTCAGLTVDAGATTLDFNFSSVVPPSTSVAPINVNGAVTFTGNPAVTIEAVSLPTGAGSYPLITATSMSGTAPTSVTLPGRAVGNLSIVNNTLYLNITANTDPIEWASSGAGTWDINTTQSWDDSTGAATDYLQPVIPGDSVVFGDTYISAATTVTLNTIVSPLSVAASNSLYNYTISGTGGIAGSAALSMQGTATLILDCTNTYTGGTTIGAGTLQLGDGVTNNGVVAGNILNNASLVFSNFNIQTESGAISGTGSLSASGPSTLTLGGVNSYTGPTTNTAGMVFTSTSSQTLSGVVSGVGALTQNGSGGTLTLSGVNTYTGPTTISAGTLAIGGTGQLGSGTYSQAIIDNGTLTDGSSAAQTLSGVISGTGALLNSGTGTLTLSGANTYSGNTTISAGIVTVNSIADSGTSGINASTNTLTLSGGELQYTGSAAVTTTRAVALSGTASTIDLPNGNLEFNSQLHSGTFTKTSAGTLTLSGTGDNSSLGINVNGGTVILNKTSISTAHGIGATTTVNNGGTLQLSGTGNFEIYTGTAVTVNNGGVLDVNSRSDSFSTLVLSGNGIGGSGALINSTTSATSYLTNAAGGIILAGNTSIGGSGNLWLQCAVSGTNTSLNYIGSGTLTLAGTNNPYSGNTIVSSGTLSLKSAIASPGIIIGGGATLDLTPLLPTIITLTSQTVSNSSSTAVLNGSLNLGTATASLSYAAGTPSVSVTSGTLTVAPNSVVKVNNTGAALAAGTYTIISAGSGGAVAFSGVAPAVTVGGGGLAGDCTASLSVTGGALQLSVVAHPPTITNSVVTQNVTAGLAWKIAITNLASVAGWSDPLGHTITLSSVGPMSTNGISVTADANYIYYHTNVRVADQFGYTITDGTLTANGTVNLAPVSQPGPSINTPSINGNGNPTFSGFGIPGYVYGVESATNLPGPWIEATNTTAGANGAWSVTDLSQTSPTNIFYRLYYPDNPGNPPQ